MNPLSDIGLRLHIVMYDVGCIMINNKKIHKLTIGRKGYMNKWRLIVTVEMSKKNHYDETIKNCCMK